MRQYLYLGAVLVVLLLVLGVFDSWISSRSITSGVFLEPDIGNLLGGACPKIGRTYCLMEGIAKCVVRAKEKKWHYEMDCPHGCKDQIRTLPNRNTMPAGNAACTCGKNLPSVCADDETLLSQCNKGKYTKRTECAKFGRICSDGGGEYSARCRKICTPNKPFYNPKTNKCVECIHETPPICVGMWDGSKGTWSQIEKCTPGGNKLVKSCEFGCLGDKCKEEL